MTAYGAAAVRIGDVVRFQDREWEVGGLDSATAYLTSRDRPPAAVTLATLFSDPGFVLVTQGGRQRRPLPPTAVFDALAVKCPGAGALVGRALVGGDRRPALHGTGRRCDAT